MNATSTSATIGRFYGNQSFIPKSLIHLMATCGTKVIMPVPDKSAKLTFPHFMTSTAGSIVEPNPSLRTEPVDPEERVIASMSTEELLAEVCESRGLWADREEVEELILSSRKDDRLEEYYAAYSEDPEKVV